MNQMGNVVLSDDVDHLPSASYVRFGEVVLGMKLSKSHVVQTASVRQAVHVDDLCDLWAVNDMPDEVGADESASSSDKYVHTAAAITVGSLTLWV